MRYSYAVVLARVRAYIAADGQGEQGVYELWRVRAGTALQLGIVFDVTALTRDEQLLGAQVRRAMDAITAEGTLVKVPCGQYGPDGIRDGRWSRCCGRARPGHDTCLSASLPVCGRGTCGQVRSLQVTYYRRALPGMIPR